MIIEAIAAVVNGKDLDKEMAATEPEAREPKWKSSPTCK